VSFAWPKLVEDGERCTAEDDCGNVPKTPSQPALKAAYGGDPRTNDQRDQVPQVSAHHELHVIQRSTRTALSDAARIAKAPSPMPEGPTNVSSVLVRGVRNRCHSWGMTSDSSQVRPEIRNAIDAFIAKDSALRMLQLVDSSNPKSHQKLRRSLANFSDFKSTVSQIYVNDNDLRTLLHRFETRIRKENLFFFLSEDPALDGMSLTGGFVFAALSGSLFGTFAVSADGFLALYKSESPGEVLVLQRS
jgi:hypothetical protein